MTELEAFTTARHVHLTSSPPFGSSAVILMLLVHQVMIDIRCRLGDNESKARETASAADRKEEETVCQHTVPPGFSPRTELYGKE